MEKMSMFHSFFFFIYSLSLTDLIKLQALAL